MADFAVATAAKMLTRWLVEEPILLSGVSGEVQNLRDTLLWMQSFLKYADATQARSETFQTWMSQIREVTFDAEVLLETYYWSRAAWWTKVMKPIHLHKIRTKIKKITTRLVNISKQRENFDLTVTPNQEDGERLRRLRDLRQRSPNMQDEDLVDLAEATEALITQLSATERPRCVVSIVGMGGLGKTTLAKKIYNHPQLGNRFDCRSFVYVSQDFNRREILQRIIVQVGCPGSDCMESLENDNEMVEKLHNFLKNKRYLVVLDDIWRKEDWDGLKDAFPCGKMGSKVMITTRFRDIAEYADPMSKSHEPRMLTEEESLTLLLRIALPGTDDIPLNMRKLGRQMAIKCGGLPLAVIVLGGLLRSKTKTAVEWERVLHNISWHLISGQPELSEILALSYFDLPSHLKSCFLHLGLFPEGSFIEKHNLIRLWVAEGFLPQRGKEIAEGVAEDCLNELIDRCMIQVGTLTSLGSIKTIRIHDILRDFSVLKGKEENFLGIYSEQESEILASQQPPESQRRLAIHASYKGYSFINSYTCVRSLHFFGKVGVKIDFGCKNFKLLRILDLNFRSGNRTKDTFIGDLHHLRFLRLEGPEKYSGLSSLRNLQTLDMTHCAATLGIPKKLKMKNARHVLLPSGAYCTALGGMIHLQTLKGIWGGAWIYNDDGLSKMINLRRLDIVSLSRHMVMTVIYIVKILTHLQSLSLNNRYERELFPSLDGLCQCDHLLKLSLCGGIERLPAADGFPRNLVKLVLKKANLQKDSIVTLEKLPNLKMLSLGYRSYPFNELICSSEGFPELEVLHLIWENLEVWEVQERALKKLRKLIIHTCSNLKQVSEGFKSLTTLEEIGIDDSPTFENMVQTDEDMIEFTRYNPIKVYRTSIRRRNI